MDALVLRPALAHARYFKGADAHRLSVLISRNSHEAHALRLLNLLRPRFPFLLDWKNRGRLASRGDLDARLAHRLNLLLDGFINCRRIYFRHLRRTCIVHRPLYGGVPPRTGSRMNVAMGLYLLSKLFPFVPRRQRCVCGNVFYRPARSLPKDDTDKKRDCSQNYF